MHYYREGKTHRLDGPAVILIDLENDVHTYEAYFMFGVIHRPFDHPAIIERDAETGNVVRETYKRNGKHCRTNGPVDIRYDRVTGEITEEYFHDPVTNELQPKPSR